MYNISYFLEMPVLFSEKAKAKIEKNE